MGCGGLWVLVNMVSTFILAMAARSAGGGADAGAGAYRPKFFQKLPDGKLAERVVKLTEALDPTDSAHRPSGSADANPTVW
jgi:hypothetical protein